MNYGLLGKKLGHSYSSEIHSSIGKYPYSLIELDDEGFSSFLKRKDFKGINITIPYKEKVMEYLNFISPEVKEIRACNTVVNREGILYGYNTDTLGLQALIERFNIEIEDKTILILGTGGTSKTISYTVKKLGAKNIYFASRLKKENTYTYDELDSIAPEIEIIFNSTPVGMFPNNEGELIYLDKFTSLKGVIDVIYNPIKTNLVNRALSKGVKAVGGLYMLVAQAFYAIEKFLDVKLDEKLIEEEYQRILKEKQNVVLIGMPSSGKTTIGEALSKSIKKDFIDLDQLFAQRYELHPGDYISKYGESNFREKESILVKEVSRLNNRIISTGGGVILREENILNLKQNGKLYFLDRSLQNLIPTSSRPLSSSREELKKRYEERYNLYVKASDVIIDGNREVEEIVKKIKEDI